MFYDAIIILKVVSIMLEMYYKYRLEYKDFTVVNIVFYNYYFFYPNYLIIKSYLSKENVCAIMIT